MLHITCPPDIRTNRDVNQLFAVWTFCLLYTQYGPHGQTKAMLFRPGTVPVPVLVLSLIAIDSHHLFLLVRRQDVLNYIGK